MKKKVIGLMVSSMLFAGTAFAAGDVQSNTGCGLGAQALGKSSFSESLVGNLVVTFLNSISGNQTFAISSGTSECKKPTKIVQNERVKEFVAANMDNLAKDIASGNGESLETLAELLGVSNENKPAVFASLQSNFSGIFASENTQAADVIDNIINTIKG